MRALHRLLSSVMTSFGSPNQNLRGVFAGAGSDGLNEATVVDAILSLVPKPPAEVRVLYLGTATYDHATPRERQTRRLAAAGCVVVPLDVAFGAPSRAEMMACVDLADVVVVSGGNSLFAVGRWLACGLKPMLRAAMERGAVMCGGSAGALCWFDGGHSDSMDPDSYAGPLLAQLNSGSENGSDAAADRDESSGAPADAADAKSWEYIRIGALGFLPGLLCPHHDRVQSNGVLRADDFDAMLKRHSGEHGICIDHWAALVVEGAEYRVLAVPGKPGSVLGGDAAPDGTRQPVHFSRDGKGRPGVWTKDVQEDDGSVVVVASCVPEVGRLEDILRPATVITSDPREDLARAANPDRAPPCRN